MPFSSMFKDFVILTILIGSNTADQSQVSADCKYIEDMILHRVTRVEKEREDEILRKIVDDLQNYLVPKQHVICMIYKKISSLRNVTGKHYVIQYQNVRKEKCVFAFDEFESGKLEWTIQYCKTPEGFLTFRRHVDKRCRFLEDIAEDLLFPVDEDETDTILSKVHKELKLSDIKKNQVVCIVWGGLVNSPEFSGRDYIIQYQKDDGNTCLLSYDTYTPPCYVKDRLDFCPDTTLTYHDCTLHHVEVEGVHE